MKTHFKIILLAYIFILPACFKTKAELREEQEISQIEKRVQKVETQKADTTVSVAELQTELASLRGKIEELEHKKSTDTNSSKTQMEEALKQLQNLTIDAKALEMRMDTLEKKYLEHEKKLNTQKNEKQIYKEKEDVPSKNDIQSGLDLLKENDTEAALTHFKKFIENNPKSTELADAYFWIGEIYFIQENYTESANHYKVVIQKHTKSRKVPESMLKVGLCFEKLGLKKEAKIFYEELYKVYPKSSQGLKAKAKLAQLK